MVSVRARQTAGLSQVDKLAVQKLQSQQRMQLACVIAVSSEVAVYHSFQLLPVNVRPRKAARIQQHFPDVIREAVTVPYPEMRELVPAQEQPFEVQRREDMVDFCQPLRHARVVGVFGPEGEVVKATRGQGRQASLEPVDTTVAGHPAQRRIAVAYHPPAHVAGPI